MTVSLNPNNKYIVLNDDILLISNRTNNLVITKSDFARLKHDISVNNEIDSFFIVSDIIIYPFQEIYLLNEELKKYRKLNLKELSRKKIDYIKFDSVVFIILKDLMISISYWDYVHIQKGLKISLSCILKNNYYQTVFTRNIFVFFCLKKRNVRCIYVCEKPFLFYKKVSVNNLLFLEKKKKAEFFSRKKKFVNFEEHEISSDCKVCAYIYICGGTLYSDKKNCNRIKKIIKNSYCKELKK